MATSDGPPALAHSTLAPPQSSMASTLCCIAEQEGRSDSPELPNARLSGATPAKQPLLPKLTGSPNSRFTSVRSEEFHELHQIFEHAGDHADEHATPPQAPRARFSRASIYSLHSLHKMTSMRSLLKRKFSRDLPKRQSGLQIHIEAVQKVVTSTVVKANRSDTKQQLNVTKDDLRKDLLSFKRPDEGGYDSDAEILDDLARNIGKKTPSKRASIHSVNWSPSVGSKATPGSSTKSRTGASPNKYDLHNYQIQMPSAVSLATRVGHVFSTPNLRIDVSNGRERPFRRSQSAASMGLPRVSPLSPLSPFRLPSLTDHDQNGVPWSEAIHESLRLSQFPTSPACGNPQDLSILSSHGVALKSRPLTQRDSNTDQCSFPRDIVGNTVAATVGPVETPVRQLTSNVIPRPSASVRDLSSENTQPSKSEGGWVVECEEEEDPRHSVYLHSMRISHHLRSGSLLSWEQLADTPELPPGVQPYCERSVSDQSKASHLNKLLARHERQTSSSGFASSKVPSRWGRALPKDQDSRADGASSIYSSRPQSPPDSFVVSLTSLRPMGPVHDDHKSISIHPPRTRRSNSFPSDHDDTPRAAARYGSSNLKTVQGIPMNSSSPVVLARKNSVADTKKSKFREEFSPSPTRNRVTPSESIVKFLNLKRLSGRSRSEASIKPESPVRSGDAAFDTLKVPSSRERRQSESMMSLQTEQRASSKTRGADHVWNQALRAHQEEKASLFLPKNRDLAAHASPFRERSGSIMTRHSGNERSSPTTSITAETQNSSGILFAPSYSPSPAPKAFVSEQSFCPRLTSRRSAIMSPDMRDADREISAIFGRQGDSPDVVGAWGQYPSHTRDERTNSAGKIDRVESRDFALEAAIRFASAQDIDEDLIDPIDRIPSMSLVPGEERKKKVDSGRMAKSNSMKFGKTFLKNYALLFKSSSTEFRKHGRNHRSSVATGGVLEFPELELLPEVGNRRSSVDVGSDQSQRRECLGARRRANDSHPVEQKETHDSMATLRPRRNSSAPNLNEVNYDGANDEQYLKDNARMWSVYYDDCIPSYPSASLEYARGLEDFGPTRFSFEGRNPSMRSRTVPHRLARHSRNVSRVSYTSAVSRGSVRLSSKCMGDDDDFLEKRSMVSVRRSTMDLISKFKEQEIIERERVLSMTRTGSHYESTTLAAL